MKDKARLAELAERMPRGNGNIVKQAPCTAVFLADTSLGDRRR